MTTTRETKRKPAKTAKSSHASKSDAEKRQYMKNITAAPGIGSTAEQDSSVADGISGTSVASEPEGQKVNRQRLSPPSKKNAKFSIREVISWTLGTVIAVLAILGSVYKFGAIKTQIESNIQKLDENHKNLGDRQRQADADIKSLGSDTGKIRERLAGMDVEIASGKSATEQLKIQMEETKRTVQELSSKQNRQR